MTLAKVYQAVPSKEVDIEAPAEAAAAAAKTAEVEEQVVEAKVVSASQDECTCRYRNPQNKLLIVLGILGLIFFAHQHVCRRRSASWNDQQRVSLCVWS